MFLYFPIFRSQLPIPQNRYTFHYHGVLPVPLQSLIQGADGQQMIGSVCSDNNDRCVAASQIAPHTPCATSGVSTMGVLYNVSDFPNLTIPKYPHTPWKNNQLKINDHSILKFNIQVLWK